MNVLPGGDGLPRHADRVPVLANDLALLQVLQGHLVPGFDGLTERLCYARFSDEGILRANSQVDVIVYTGDHPFWNALGRFWIRLMSWLSYAW